VLFRLDRRVSRGRRSGVANFVGGGGVVGRKRRQLYRQRGDFSGGLQNRAAPAAGLLGGGDLVWVAGIFALKGGRGIAPELVDQGRD
jgi:hypothetical protein